jgi:hypothetical protein
MPFDLDEFDAKEDEPTGEEVPADLEALRQQQQQAARNQIRRGPGGLAPLPPPQQQVQNDQAASDLIQEVMQPQQTAEEAIQVSADTYMDDIDKRLAVAACYRTVLDGSMFNDPMTEAAAIVDFEIKAGVRERLGILLGFSPDKVTKSANQLSDAEVDLVRRLGEFSREQIIALKLLADKMVQASNIQAPPEEPKQEQAPAKPIPASPVLKARRAPAAPSLAVRQAPPSAAPMPAATIPQPQAAPTRRGPGRPPGSPNKPKPKVTQTRVIEDPINGGTREIEVARIQRPTGMLPFPSVQAMEQLTATQSSQSAASRVASPEVARAIIGIANTPSND